MNTVDAWTPAITSWGWNYCWWTKSCTTKDDDYPIIYRVLIIPGGAWFCPSTVVVFYSMIIFISISGPPIPWDSRNSWYVASIRILLQKNTLQIELCHKGMYLFLLVQTGADEFLKSFYSATWGGLENGFVAGFYNHQHFWSSKLGLQSNHFLSIL